MITDLLQQLVAQFRHWNHRRATIHALRKLSDWQLRDIGLSRGEIPAVVDSALGTKDQTHSPDVLAATRLRVRPKTSDNGGRAIAA